MKPPKYQLIVLLLAIFFPYEIKAMSAKGFVYKQRILIYLPDKDQLIQDLDVLIEREWAKET